jgi:hypothetical protein
MLQAEALSSLSRLTACSLQQALASLQDDCMICFLHVDSVVVSTICRYHSEMVLQQK